MYCFVWFDARESQYLICVRFPEHRMGEGGEDIVMRLPDFASPPLLPSTEHTLSASAEPSLHARTQPSLSLSADPFSSAVGFPGHRRAGEGGEDTAMILPSLSVRSEPSLSAEGTLIDDPFSSAEPSTTSINNQLSSSKKPFVPKLPRRHRNGQWIGPMEKVGLHIKLSDVLV